MKKELVAPCGMNCNVCSGYLAYERDLPKRKGNVKCKGCRPRNKQCAFVKKRCGDRLMKNEVQYCFECDKYPCEHIEKISSKYEKNYGVSFIENLNYIKEHGVKKFLEKEKARYKCKECGGTTCIHNGKCYDHEKVESWKG